MKKIFVSAIVIWLLENTGSVLAQPATTGQVSTTVTYDRLTFILAGAWSLEEKKTDTVSFLQATLPEKKDAVLLVFPSRELGSQSLPEFLQKVIETHNQGRRVVSFSHKTPQLDSSSSGINCAVKAQQTRGAKGDTWFAVYYAFDVGGKKAQCVALVAGSAELFQELATSLSASLDQAGLVQIEAVPQTFFPTELRKVAALEFDIPTQEIGRCCFSLTIPSYWKQDTEKKLPNSIFLFWANKKWENGAVAIPVVCQVIVIDVHDPKTALEFWLANRLPSVGNDVKGKISSRKVKDFMHWQLPSGTKGATMLLDEYENERLCSNLWGYLVYENGCALFLGSASGVTRQFSALSLENKRTAHREFVDLCKKDLAAAVSHCRLELPPTQQQWADWLIKKKNYRYLWEWSSGGPSEFWVVRSKSANWTFYPDQTCEIKSDSYFGFSDFSESTEYAQNPGRFLDTWGRYPRNSSGSSEHDQNTKRNFFEVRGKSEDLWIVVYQKNGITTLHPVIPNAKEKYGVCAPEGLSIDGHIEGSYNENYGLWEK